MTTITITINTDNAAFEDDPWSETADILESIAQNFRDDRDLQYDKVRDSNGNTVGIITMEDEEGTAK